MTVKMLMDWPDSRDGKQYVAGNLLTTDAGTETGLVDAKMATTTLTGGTAYVAPVAQTQYHPVMASTNLTGVVRYSGPGIPDRSFPVILAQSAVPVGIAQSGTVAADGTITFANPMPNSYSSGLWLYFPATAMADGLAGFRWCVGSSTTAFLVKSPYLGAIGIPAVPEIVEAGVGSGVAYTGATIEIALASVTLPGGSMGPNGRLVFSGLGSMAAGSATSRSIRLRIASSDVVRFISTAATANCMGTNGRAITNRGVTNRQILGDPSTLIDAGYVAAVPQVTSIDTTTDQPLKAIGIMVTPTDSVVLEHFLFELLQG